MNHLSNSIARRSKIAANDIRDTVFNQQQCDMVRELIVDGEGKKSRRLTVIEIQEIWDSVR